MSVFRKIVLFNKTHAQQQLDVSAVNHPKKVNPSSPNDCQKFLARNSGVVSWDASKTKLPPYSMIELPPTVIWEIFIVKIFFVVATKTTKIKHMKYFKLLHVHLSHTQ